MSHTSEHRSGFIKDRNQRAMTISGLLDDVVRPLSINYISYLINFNSCVFSHCYSKVMGKMLETNLSW